MAGKQYASPTMTTMTNSDMPHEYVLGFLFEEEEFNHQFVVVIEKQKPEWQAGKFNGIGGHVKVEETFYEAMIREFKEETGVRVGDWKLFADMTYHNGDKVWCFVGADSEAVSKCKTQPAEDGKLVEEIHAMNRDFLREKAPTLPNIRWLAEMALAKLKHPREPVLKISYK